MDLQNLSREELIAIATNATPYLVGMQSQIDSLHSEKAAIENECSRLKSQISKANRSIVSESMMKRKLDIANELNDELRKQLEREKRTSCNLRKQFKDFQRKQNPSGSLVLSIDQPWML